MAQISLLAQAMGGLPIGKRDPQMGQSEGSRRQERQAAQQKECARQAGSARPTPQEEFGQRSDSQDFIPLSFAQAQSKEGECELGELPLTKEQMPQAGLLLQECIA